MRSNCIDQGRGSPLCVQQPSTKKTITNRRLRAGKAKFCDIQSRREQTNEIGIINPCRFYRILDVTHKSRRKNQTYDPKRWFILIYAAESLQKIINITGSGVTQKLVLW